MSISVRFACSNELYLARKIAYETWPSAYGDIISKEQMDYMLNLFYSDQSLIHQYNHQQHKFLLAFNAENNLAGFASYSATGDEGNCWKLHKLYVLPQMQRSGTGKALVQFIFNEMHKANVQTLLLNVNRENKAIQFYKKTGFSIIRTEDIDIGEGYFMNDYVMQTDLTKQAGAFA